MLDMRPPVAVTPAQKFAPARARADRGRRQGFQTARQSRRFPSSCFASPFFDFDAQAVRRHFIRAIGHKGRAGIERLGRLAAALRKRRKVRPFRRRVRRIPFFARLARAAVRVERGQRLGVDDRNGAIQRRQNRRDFVRHISGPPRHCPAKSRRAARPSGVQSVFAAAPAPPLDVVAMLCGKIAAAASAAFSPSQITTGALRFRAEIGQVDKAGDGPAKRQMRQPSPSRHETGRNVFLAVRLIPARGIEGGFVVRRRIAPEAIRLAPDRAAPPRARPVPRRPADRSDARLARARACSHCRAHCRKFGIASEARIDRRRHPLRRPPISSPSICASNRAASPCETSAR